MVRAPCCEKVGLKKGPWSPEEDRVLVNFINLYGHDNWRALPKQAGLLRCGKSCRLRWTNYLRPDIKRGNFSREEEGTIIALHQQLGNRWSAIAAKLPGRTDNEIKNVWHTHLKKRVLKQPPAAAAPELSANTSNSSSNSLQEENPGKMSSSSNEEASESPQQSSSDETSSSTNTKVDLPEDFPEMDEEFWSEVLSADTCGTAAESSATTGDPTGLEFAFFDELLTMEPVGSDGMEFWYDMFTRAGELPELLEF